MQSKASHRLLPAHGPIGTAGSRALSSLQQLFQLLRKTLGELYDAVGGDDAIGRHGLVGFGENLGAEFVSNGQRGECRSKGRCHERTHPAILDQHGRDDVVGVADAPEGGDVAFV